MGSGHGSPQDAGRLRETACSVAARPGYRLVVAVYSAQNATKEDQALGESMNLFNHPKTVCAATLAFALLAATPAANADFPVVDLLNLRQAVVRLQELRAMYTQGKAQLEQVQLQYNLA